MNDFQAKVGTLEGHKPVGVRDAATIQAVAKVAKVSKTTVSHVLSGKRPVSDATRRNVLRVMEELGFQPNYFAQALNANRSLAVALIVQDLTNPYYPLLGRGLELAMGEAGYVVMLFDGAARPDAAEAAVKIAIQRRVDGVVLAAAGVDRAASTLRRAGVAVVAVGSGPALEEVDWVSADDERIAHDAVTHLIQAGHRSIATIMGPADGSPGAPRFRGFRQAMADLGVPEDESLIVEGDWTRESGAIAMATLLGRPRRPTAVFCANDMMAIGALDTVLGRGLKAPEDIALVGVDDIDAAALVRPSLTTVRIPSLEIGRMAGALLLDRLSQGAAAPSRHILIQHSLVIRQSS
jgi:LacI family transcriptional regulator